MATFDALRHMADLLETQAALLRALAAQTDASPPPVTDGERLSIAAAGRRIGVSKGVLQRAIARRELVASKLGPHTWRIAVGDLNAWIARRSSP